MHGGLKERIFSFHHQDSYSSYQDSPVSDLSSGYQCGAHPKHYSQWSDISMIKAMSAVENGMTIRQACLRFNVPKSSLHDRVSGKVLHGSRPGPQSYLTTIIPHNRRGMGIRQFSHQIGYDHSLPISTTDCGP